MKLALKPTPRVFTVGQRGEIQIKDLGEIELAPNEMITFVTETGKRFDFTRKDWGYYATPSVNKRLKQEGFKTALVRNQHGQVYVMVVDADQQARFEQYCREENQVVTSWLDVAGHAEGGERCAFCHGTQWHLVFQYDAPPQGETRFRFFQDRPYHREIWRCQTCGHFVSRMEVNLDELYAGEYVAATYGADGLRHHYDRIMALPAEQSDNVQRVNRIIRFMTEHKPLVATDPRRRVLDIGSGLAVFPARMKAAGWNCVALDPDPHAVEHARQVVGVEAICGDFRAVQDLERCDLITFNKVLEHVPDPVAMLARCALFLKPQGTVYVEVPDGEAASREGQGREEFFIEHLGIFSLASLSLLATRSGFRVIQLERLREPSGKFTLCTFLEPANYSED